MAIGAYPLLRTRPQEIFPGRLINASTLTNATPIGLGVARAAGSYSLQTDAGSSSFQVDEVEPGPFALAQTTTLLSATNVTPQNFNTSYKRINDAGGIASFIGVSTQAYTADLGSFLVPSTATGITRYVMKLEQSYFTTSYNAPSALADFFASEVTPAGLAEEVSPGNPPAYLSEVTYGRALFLLIETDDDPNHTRFAVEATSNQVARNNTGAIDLAPLQSLSNLQLKVAGISGITGDVQLNLTNSTLEALESLLEAPIVLPSAAPIKFITRSLDDRSIVERQLTHTFQESETFPAASTKTPFIRHWANQLEEVLGPVGAAYVEAGTTIVLISKDGQQAVRSTPDNLEGPFPVEQLFGGSIPFAGGIGAACNIEGGDWPSATIMAVDMSGENFAYWLGSRWTSPKPIADLGRANGANNPLGNSGCGAIIWRAKDSQGPSSRYMFDAAGANYTFYLNSPSNFRSRFALRQWGTDDSCPFSTVSAGAGMDVGSSWVVLHFDTEGDEMSVYESQSSISSNTFSVPFSL
ncbi:MAG: thiol-activated cytolysin family protein [Saprospiraceae bacterium]